MNPSPGALAAFGWSERVLALFNDLDDPTLEPARIVRVERSLCVAACADATEQRVRAFPLPAVGDWVALRDGAVHAILRRWSAISRADPSGPGEQVLAADVDVVLVAAPADRLSPARVERELAIAWESGAAPLVLLTKSDLADPAAGDELAERLAGADVLAVSATTGSGLEDLAERLRPGRTAALIGPSGAGKSSLVNALSGEERLATGEVRGGDRRGRHTTTSRQLVALGSGGVLIDTPGLRSIGLTAEVAVGHVFPDIEELAATCRFGDCRHEREPGCAVVEAATTGTLEPGRLASFRKLERELAAEARRHDPLARQAERRIWKQRSAAARLYDKRRPT
ncbi:MAG TPA: ribosome small subunit-dependent GTPase A [Acidimicrobiales bacterium]|nr:ribosome small subunit-dependent GTPase A [Acidimicrobiales bacterium]